MLFIFGNFELFPTLFPPHLLRDIPYFWGCGLLLFISICISSRIVAFEVVADDEGSADAEGNEAGKEPGAETEGDVGEKGRQEIADGVEADGERQTDHARNEAGTQHAPAAAVTRVAVTAIDVGIQARVDHCHALDVLDIAQQDDEAKENGERDKPADKDS